MLKLVLGILGSVRSGTTPLGMALGSHPEMGFVGETHHVLPDRIANYRSNHGGAPPTCAACGASCPVWIPTEMPSQARGLHARLAERLGRMVLVDSSKDVSAFLWYRRMNPAVEFRFVVTIKPPDRQVASYRRYGMMQPLPWSVSYVSEYARIMDFVRQQRFVVVDYLDLIHEPKPTLARVAALVGIDPGPLDPATYPVAHQIGGNDRAIRARKPIDAGADADWSDFRAEIPADVRERMEATYQRVRAMGGLGA